MNAKNSCTTTLLFGIALVNGGCSVEKTDPGVSLKVMADSLHIVMEADRTAYARYVVTRLVNEEKVIKATEHWRNDKTLPLPAQMFRLGSELVQEKEANFSYTLVSEWPINKKNAPRTEAEKEGLKLIREAPGTNYYTEEELGGRRYFTALYPDVAVAKACVTCHNDHPDSPRDDFKIGDIMGAIAIRIPL